MASFSTNSSWAAVVLGIYQKTVGYSAIVSPNPDSGTKAMSESLPWTHGGLGPRVAPPSLFSGGGPLVGGVKVFSHSVGNLPLIESVLNGGCICAGVLTAIPIAKLTASSVVRIMNLDERLNQAISNVFFRKQGLVIKMAEQKPNDKVCL